MCDRFQEAAQNLLNHYVRIQGLAVSQMLRKSVETRDWLHTIEPRTVREDAYPWLNIFFRLYVFSSQKFSEDFISRCDKLCNIQIFEIFIIF